MAKDGALTFDVDANDNASDVLNKVQREVKQTGSAADEWNAAVGRTGKQADQTGSALDLLGGKFGKVAAAGAGLAAAGYQVGQALVSANQVAAEFDAGWSGLETSIKNATSSADEATQLFARMSEQVRQLADDGAVRIPEVAEGARQLTFRLGSAAEASANLDRLMGLAALTGEDMKQTAKDLGEALTGDINALKELGILTESQIQEFNAISDAGERTAAAMEVLDQKIKGATETQRDNESATDRMARKWEELQAAIGGSSVVEGTLDGIADGFSGIVDGVVEFGTAWDQTAPGLEANLQSVREETERLEQATKDLDATLDTGGRREADRLQKLADQNKATAEWILQQKVARGELVEGTWDYWRAEQAINAQFEQRQQHIDATFGKTQEALDVHDQQLEVLRLETMAAEARGAIEQENLRYQAAQLKLQLDFAKQMDEATSARRNEQLQSELELRTRKMAAEHEERIATLRKEAAEQADKSAKMSQMEYFWLNQIKEVSSERNQISQTYWENYRQNLERSVEQSRQLADNMMAASTREIEAIGEVGEFDAEEAEIRARVRGGDIREAGDVISGAATGLGQAGDALSAAAQREADQRRGRIEALREELELRVEAGQLSQEQAEAHIAAEQRKLERFERQNAALMRQMQLYSQMGQSVGELTGSIGKLAQQQWDFESATEATVSGLNAMSGIGGVAASLLGDSTREVAGIRAIFETAAAAGATALGITTGNPQFFAAAAQHGIAATTYGLVAGGAIGPSGGGGGGAGGGGGGGSSVPQFDLDRQRELSARAFAEALGRVGRGGDVYITNDFSRATTLESAPAVGERIYRASERAAQTIIGRGPN